jgi:hypothetical protein
MRPLSETLTDLIAFAEETITHPRRVPNLGDTGRFPQLAAEIRRADARPADGVRATRTGLVMVIALEAFFAGDREPTSQLLGLAGCALPWLRGEAWIAMKNEKEARGT